MNPEDTQKDQKWGWIIVTGNIICFFVFPGHVRSFGIFVVPIQTTFDVNYATVTSILTVRSATFMISALAAPGLSDRFTERKVVIVATFINLIGSLIIFFAHHIASFYAWAIISGFCYGCTIIPTQTTVGKYFRNRRALAISICSSGGTLGQLILPPLCALLIDKYSLFGTFLIVGGLSFNCAAAGALQRPLNLHSNRQPNDNSADRPASMDNASVQLITQPSSFNTQGYDRHPSENALTPGECFDLDSADDTAKLAVDGTNTCHKWGDTALSTKENPQTGLLNTNEDIAVPTKYNHHALSMVEAESLVSIHRVDEIGQQIETSPTNSASIYEQLKGFLQRQFDVRLLRIPRFVIVVVINGLCFALIRGCKMFLIAMAKEKIGVSSGLSLLLTVNACMDIPGRIVIAMVIDSKVLQAHYIVMLCSLLSAVATCFYPLADQYWTMMLTSAITGITSATAANMALPVVVELVGDLRMSKGLGWYMFAMAFIPMIVIQILGSIRDATGGYDAVYYLAGGTMITIILTYFIISFIIDRTAKSDPNSLKKEPINERENNQLTTSDDDVEEKI